MDDRGLITRVLAGDVSAERELYDAHVDRVFRLVYRMAGDLDQAQDYVQETFIRAFSHLADFRGDSALSTWLGSIAISVTLNGLRKVKRFRVVFGQHPDEFDFPGVNLDPAAYWTSSTKKVGPKPKK